MADRPFIPDRFRPVIARLEDALDAESAATVPDLAAYLEARWAEEEETLRRAAFAWGPDWTPVNDGDDSARVTADGSGQVLWSEDIDCITHAATWDPARVLADLTAKRAILALYVGAKFTLDCHPDDMGEQGHVNGIRKAIQALAQAYAARPDFMEEWRT